MCALKSRGMSVVCTWGLRGIFFLILVLFVLFPTVLCACVCVLFPAYVLYNSPLSYVHTVLFSNTPDFMLKYPACVLLTICRLTTWRHLTSSLLQPHPNSIATMNSHLRRGGSDTARRSLAAVRRRRQRQRRWRQRNCAPSAAAWRRRGGGGSVSGVGGSATARRWRQLGGGAAVAAHSATVAARWQQRRGCGGGGSATS